MGAAPEDVRWAKFITEGEPDECWEWQGALSPRGYGTFSIHRPGYPGQIPASRAALVRAGITFKPGECALHDCDNPPCVNPAHLYVGDRKQNALDCTMRGRRPSYVGWGERHWSAKYSDAEVESWKARHAAGESFKSIARTTEAHFVTVSRTVRGLQRKPKENSDV